MDDDADHLSQFGYKQSLDRKLGSFSTFAAGFSYISILTGAFQLFYVAFGFAGPAFLWTWPVVVFGQFCVGLCFAELSAHYPFAGSVYAWSKQLASRAVSWMAGWLMLVACTVTVAGVALAMQVVLPPINPWFQFIGDGTGEYDFAGNAVILGSVLIVLTTIVNSVGVRLISVINNIGVFVELVAATLLIVLLAVHIQRGPQVILETNGAGAGEPGGFFSALLASSLLATYILWGFDTAGSVAEETIDPRRKSPQAILRALAASALTGALIMLFGMMAVGDITAPELSTSGLPYIVNDVLGEGLGAVFLTAAAISIAVCCLTVQTGTVRIAFALARDNNLPLGDRIAKVSDRTKTPVLPTLIVGAIAILILVVNIQQPQIFTVITSVVVVLAYSAYLLVTVPMLIHRLRGTWPLQEDSTHGLFSLGRWGIPVNVAAVAMGLFAVINMIWPREVVYNPAEPKHWYLQWGGVLLASVLVLGGALWYLLVQRHRSGVLVEHMFTTTAPASPAEPVRAPKSDTVAR